MKDIAAPIGCPVEIVNDLFATTGTGKGMPLNQSQGFTTIEPTIYGWIQHCKLLSITQVVACCGGVAYLMDISRKTKKVLGKPSRQAHYTADGWRTIEDGDRPVYMEKEDFDRFLESWRKTPTKIDLKWEAEYYVCKRYVAPNCVVVSGKFGSANILAMHFEGFQPVFKANDIALVEQLLAEKSDDEIGEMPYLDGFNKPPYTLGGAG